MPRGYRLAIVAAFGCLIAASPPRHAAERHRAEPAHDVSDRLRELNGTIKTTSDTGDLNKPCRHKASDRNSQLCARWKSADASEASATWAKGTFWVGVGGAIAGFLALAIAWKAALFTRDAVKETRRIGEAQVRCYPSLNDVFLICNPNGIPSLWCELTNHGQSPAFDVVVDFDVHLTDDSGNDLPCNMDPPLAQTIQSGKTLVTNQQACPVKIPDRMRYDIIGENAYVNIVVYTKITWKDVSGISDTIYSGDCWLEGTGFQPGGTYRMIPSAETLIPAKVAFAEADATRAQSQT